MPKAARKASIPASIEPMEARLVSELPTGAGWQFEPKWDGFRCVVLREGERVDLQAKSGKPLARYFPEVVERVRALKPRQFVLDGELAIPIGMSLSFDALQMRLHPAASRVRKLSNETPATLMLFDFLYDAKGRSLLDESFEKRRGKLEQFFESSSPTDGLVLTPYTREQRVAQKWLNETSGSLDGVIAKQLDLPYISGERAMLKVKRLRTADCVVGGFRYGTNSKLVGSLLLGLYTDQGLLDHVGFTSALPMPSARR